MTVASEYLAKHQKSYPPRYVDSQSIDRALRLYQNLAPVLIPSMQDLFSNGLVVVGEVGRNTPDIQNIRISSDSFVIEFNSGMMDFVYTVARCLAGRLVRNTLSDPDNEAALALSEVVQQTAKIFMQWKWYKRWLWKLRRIRYPEFGMVKGVHKWVEDISTIAELFMLAHEIGHILLEKKILPPLTANTEKDADTIAMMLLAKFASKRGEDHTFIFAGAVFAIRIFAGLEKVGVGFSSEYPPQAERIENIYACMLSLCPSRQYFHEISRIAVAYQDMMDSVENYIVKRSDPFKPDKERIIVRLIAELLDVVLGRLPKEKLITDFVKIAEQTPADIMKQVVENLDKYYVVPPQKETFIDKDTKKKMGLLITEILPELSSKKKCFTENNNVCGERI